MSCIYFIISVPLLSILPRHISRLQGTGENVRWFPLLPGVESRSNYRLKEITKGTINDKRKDAETRPVVAEITRDALCYSDTLRMKSCKKLPDCHPTNVHMAYAIWRFV